MNGFKLVTAYAACCLLAAMAVSGCASPSGGVADKVLTDFGLRAPDEDYEAPSDRVYARLRSVGNVELKRLNQENRHGEVKFQEGDGMLEGKYYKEVKLYDDFRPLDAQRLSRGTRAERGYVGYIEFSYTVHESERMSSRAKAEAASANIRTNQRGKEVYHYTFDSGGVWNGEDGELTGNF